MNDKAVLPSLSREFVKDYQAAIETIEILRAQCAVFADPTFQKQQSGHNQNAGHHAAELERLREELRQSQDKLGELEANFKSATERERQEKLRSMEVETQLNQARDTAETVRAQWLLSQAELQLRQQQLSALQDQLIRLQEELVTQRTPQVDKASDTAKLSELETQLKQAKDVIEGYRIEQGRLRDKLKTSQAAAEQVYSEESLVTVGQLQMTIEDLKQQNQRLYGEKRRLEKLIKDMRDGK